jgi:general secretion pathway protein C
MMRREDIAKIAYPLMVCGLINVAAYFQAKGINALVSTVLIRSESTSEPPIESVSFPRPTSWPEHETSADPALARNPFDSLTGPLVGPRPRPSVVARRAEASCDDVRASLVAVGDDPSWSFASLAKAGKAPLLRRIGDDVAGRTVLAIKKDRVLLGDGDAVCEVKLGKMSKATRAAEASAVSRGADDELVVHRSELTAWLAKPTARLGRVRVAPAAGGLRVQGVKAGSPLAGLGLHDGDVLKSVNGKPLSDPAASIGALTGLLSESRVDVVIERAGAPVTVRVEIRD